MSIFYFDALAGAGKTRALARYSDLLAQRGFKVLFVQPSRLLITNTIRDEIRPLAPRYPVTPIHSDVVEEKVIATLMAHFENAGPGGEIVFTTHAALLLMPFIEKADQWHLILDEVIGADVFEELKLPETHGLITDHITFEPTGAAYGRLVKRGAA